MLEALALEASAPGDSLVRDDAGDQSEAARELLEQLAVRDTPAAVEPASRCKKAAAMV